MIGYIKLTNNQGDNMNENKVKEDVLNYYAKGHHCAESIAMAILDIFDQQSAENSGKLASGFWKGIGKSTEDVCGAVSGGVIALSSLYGRKKGDENIEKLCVIATEYRKRFIEQFGSTICHKLIDEVEKRDDLESCRSLTANAAVILFSLIREHNE